MDLLEGLSNNKAQLPVQDVLSIFFQVLAMPQMLCYTSSCQMTGCYDSQHRQECTPRHIVHVE